jgi:hypothetical protein
MIANYDLRVAKMEEVLTSTYDIIEDCREQRKKVKEQLKHTLASKNSLRRKDFDMIIHDLHESQIEYEDQIKETVYLYTKESKFLTAQFLESLVSGKIEQSRKAVKKIEKNGKEIQYTIKTFQKEQKEITQDLRSLVDKSESIRIRDFKTMIEKIRVRQCERNEQIKHFLKKISEEHNQMRAVWQEIYRDKAKLRNKRA